MAMELEKKRCVPCEGGILPLMQPDAERFRKELTTDWELTPLPVTTGAHATHLRQEFKFKDFKEAIIFVDKVAELAESEGHHPDIRISWNRVKLELTTHAIGGLSENDFILARKIELLEK